MILGVVSSGDFECGGGKPDIYTKISSYMTYVQHEMEYDFQPQTLVKDAIALNLNVHLTEKNLLVPNDYAKESWF